MAEFTLIKREILPLPGIRLITAPAENGETFEENAALKAVYYSQFTKEPVFADDSGLEVEALAGAPGVFSARFAGEHATDVANNTLLLDRLAGRTQRHARFVTALALAQEGKLIRTSMGTVAGEILHEPRGTNGFGYDPLFLYPPLQRSFAELSDTEKFSVSARGAALRALLQLNY